MSRKGYLFFSAVPFLIMFVLSVPAAECGILLVDEGKPAAVIVMPDPWSAGPGSAEYSAAALLQEFIQRMSDAKLEIVTEMSLQMGRMRAEEGRLVVEGVAAVQGKNFILVGTDGIARQLGIEAGDIGIGGIHVQTFENGIALLGGPAEIRGEIGSDGGGVRYAAVELLERLGCRYLWLGRTGLVVPRKTTIEVSEIEHSYTPQIRRRGIRHRFGAYGAREISGFERLGLTEEQLNAARTKAFEGAPDISWLAWHRLGGTMPNFGHAGAGLRASGGWEAHGEKNPEWFALQADGTRDQGGDPRYRLCKSNPELITYVANDIIRRVNENPGIELVSLDLNDGGSNTGWCLCDNCKALDPPDAPKIQLTTFQEPVRPDSRIRRRVRIEHASLTDRHVYYWNSIAERVTRVHPDLLFGVSAYGRFSHPPVREKLHPNFVVRYVPEHTDYFDGWIKAGLRRVFWRPNILLVNRRHGELRSIVGQLCDAMNYFAEAGIIQTDFDSITNNWATLALSYYAAARLTWNPYLRPAEIIGDFARAGFGGGADYIIGYFNRVEEWEVDRGKDINKKLEDIPLLRGLLNRAERAGEDSEISERVAFLRLGLNFTELQLMLGDKSQRASAGRTIDRELARKLVDLNCLALRDILLNHHTALSVAQIVWGSGTFARFSSIRGRTVAPSDEALLERVSDPNYGWTGREDSLEEMFAAFGLQ